MTYDQSQSINAFLEAAAARQPAPGGGSVTALAGALATALGEMVMNYSLGKKELAEHQFELAEALKALKRARALLIEFMVEDQDAFEALTLARKLPEAADRAAFVAQAVRTCISVPQAVGAAAAAALMVCERHVERVNRFLLSDLAVCAELSMATIRCAAYNVRANLSQVGDADVRLTLADATEREITISVCRVRSIMARIHAREQAV